MNKAILLLTKQFSDINISEDRKVILKPLINYIQLKAQLNEAIRLNFICTHNSRRSHLSQIWAQTSAYYFNINNVYSYSGGTETTEIFPKIIETFTKQGFEVEKLSEGFNPVFAVKYAKNEPAIICFSKIYNDHFNPKSNFAAIVTCNSANENCPLVFGADLRIPIMYNDPKEFDGTEMMDVKYFERSLEIAQEMWYVFKSIKCMK